MIRSRWILVLSALTLPLAAAACTTSADDSSEGGEGEGALSEATCKPLAQKAKDDNYNGCQKANAFDFDKCMTPANDTWKAWVTQVDTEYNRVKGNIDPITLACKDAVSKLSCGELLNKDSDFAKQAAKLRPENGADSPQCKSVRDRRKVTCDLDANGALVDALGSDDAYIKLVNQLPSKGLAWTTALGGCVIDYGTKAAARLLCGVKSDFAYSTKWAECRKDCPSVTSTACTPDSYGSSVVACGTWQNEKSFEIGFSHTGSTCEEGKTCKRTAVCDKYDSAKRAADLLNSRSSCAAEGGKDGINVVEVTLDPKNVPTGVRTTCKAP